LTSSIVSGVDEEFVKKYRLVCCFSHHPRFRGDREHHHFLVTNGPYRLQSWSETGAVLAVFRDLSYPLGVGSFDKEVYPRRAFIRTIVIRRAGSNSGRTSSDSSNTTGTTRL